MIRLTSRPLRRQVVTAAIIAAIPLAGVAYWAATATLAEQARELREQAEAVATTAAAFLDQGLDFRDTAELDPDVLRRTIARLALPEGSTLSLRDRQGQRLAGSPNADPSVEQFRAVARVDRLGWSIEVGLPASLTEARLLALQVRNGTIAVGVFLGIFLAALAFADHIARQLGPLRTAAQRIAAGDFSDPPRTPTSSLELDELQDAFATMAGRLRAARDDLQFLQRQLVRQERLAAVGLLVSGVAHELNNPLQTIYGGIELLERQAAVDGGALDDLAFVKTQVGRARDIIRKLSRFSSPHATPPEPLDLREVVTEVVRLRKKDLDSAAIRLDLNLAPVPAVEASFTEIQQVLVNLVVNAEQALQSAERQDGRIEIRVTAENGRARLEVKDNASGVAAEDEPKLFQPFFTTKPVGRGTGLGLSVSYGIIESYGGTSGYCPNEWGGATFYFELPLIGPSPASSV